MLQFLSQIGQAILDFFSTVWNLITTLVSDLVYVVQLLGSVVSNFASMIFYLPQVWISLLVVGIGIVVIYKVIGREG